MIDPKALSQKHFIHENRDCSLRDATGAEIVEAVAAATRKETMQQLVYLLQSNIDEIDKECKHTVCYDEEGFTNNWRTCVACGKNEMI